MGVLQKMPVGTERLAEPSRRLDMGLLLALYMVAVAVNLTSVWAVSTSSVLTGEEMSVSIRDVLFSVEERAQASIWSTNFGAPVYYWVASVLDPSYSLFSARRWKAVALAFLAPLVFLTLRRRLDCTRPAAVFGGLTVTLLPGVAMFGWLSTENGLEAVVGAAGLLLATSDRSWWRAAPILAGTAVTTYTSGLAWAAVIVAVCAVRASRTGWRDVTLVAAALATGALVVVFPWLWWVAGPQRLVAGGGTVDGSPVDNALNLVEQLAVSGESYYFFGDQAALGSSVIAAAVATGVVVAAWMRWWAVWPWLAVAAVTAVLWLPAGNVPGVRRAVALSVVSALVLAVLADVLYRALRTPVVAGALVAGAAAVLLVLSTILVGWQAGHRSSEDTLTADFPIAPGPMPITFDRYYDELVSGQTTAEQMMTERDGLRTLAVVWMLADRQHKDTSRLPDPDRIIELSIPAELRPQD